MITNSVIKVKNKITDLGIISFICFATKYLLIWIYFDFFLKFFIGLPFALLIRLLKPIIFIRIGNLNASKIGPLSARPELYLCEKEKGIQPQNSYDLFIISEDNLICNGQLLKMWKRKLTVFNFLTPIYKVFKWLSLFNDHLIEVTNAARDVHGLLDVSNIHLEFLTEEIKNAKIELSKMGIKVTDNYVLIINRGQKYLDEYLSGTDFSYHEHRNVSINDFIPIAEKLTSNENYVIRVGHIVSDLLETTNPKIIDYDHCGFRTELLDIYLAATCRYIIGTDSGYLGVPGYIFRRPVVFVDFPNFEFIPPFLSSWLIIFKKYWLINEKRFMNISEILKSGVGRCQSSHVFKDSGIEVVNNTPDEIVDVVMEMEGKINGTWQMTNEDEDLQKRFWSYFQSNDLHNPDGRIRGRIGANFLRQNRELLA